MEIFKRHDVVGDAISMKATNAKHFGIVDQPQVPGVPGREGQGFIGEFNRMMADHLGKVNELQLTSDELTTKLAISPNEVNIHDVMIAAEKASLALNLTKQIRDKLVTAYQSLLNLR
jgi:flagellar hook-basal body complex protein FliE